MVEELAKQHQVLPTQVARWKKQLLGGTERVFEDTSPKAEKIDDPGNTELYEQIGKLNRHWRGSKRKWPRTVAEKRQWIDPADHHLSVREQCRLLALNRRNFYYDPFRRARRSCI
jgi:putative transposase